MWSECKTCGTPVVLEPAKETAIITAAGVETRQIDESCVLLLSHCPACANMVLQGPADAIVARIKENEPSQASIDGSKS